jgi:hypothetical protein
MERSWDKAFLGQIVPETKYPINKMLLGHDIPSQKCDVPYNNPALKMTLLTRFFRKNVPET